MTDDASTREGRTAFDGGSAVARARRRALARIRRGAGVCGLAWRRFVTRGFETAPRRTWASVAGVAASIALLLVVTGLAVGMAAPSSTGPGDAYWIVPESDGVDSPLVDSGDPQFGEVHRATDLILGADGVESATPELVAVLRLEAVESGSESESESESEYIVAVGVIPDDGVDPRGISTASMTAGDPYYADGTYDGEWTGEAVLASGAGSLLDAAPGDRLEIAGHDEELAVTAVDGADDVAGTWPIAVVHLSELQAITGADAYDGAHQFVVEGDAAAAEELEGLYDGATVRTGLEMTTHEVLDSDLALALGVAALIVAVVVGTLFVVATMTMEVAADRAQLSALAATGVGRRTRIGLYAAQSLLVATVGGFVGALVGLLGVRLANVVAAAAFDVEGLVASHPLFVGYALVAAWFVGVLSIPAVALVVRRVEDGGVRARA